MNCFALSCWATQTRYLYKIKNTNVQKVKDIVDFYARQNNMPIVDGDDKSTYVVVSSDIDDIWISSYEQINKDVYLFFFSPCDKQQVIKDLKIRFNKNKLNYTKENSKSIISSKTENAQLLIKNKKNATTNSVINQSNEVLNQNREYDFSDEAQQRYNSLASYPKITTNNINQNFDKTKVFQEQSQKTSNRLQQIPKYVEPQKAEISINKNTIPPNITLNVSMQSSVNSSSLDTDDKICVILQNDVQINNNTFIPKGSIIYGTLSQANKAGAAYKNASFIMSFDTIITEDGNQYTFKSDPIELKVNKQGLSRSAKIAGTILLATAAGIALSAVGGAVTGTDNWASVLSLGAAGGAITGGLSLIGAKGEDIEIKEGTIFTIKTK
jgi:hypothetical protein